MTMQRHGTVERKTKETRIRLTLGLDGGESDIVTSLPFLSHMLDAFACHGRFGLEVEADGDIEVDPHHLVEDCGIVLGQALSEALGSNAPVQRCGWATFPMDGSLARIALDMCGRPNLVWRYHPGSACLGGIDPHLFRDFWKGFVDGARMTLHVEVPWMDNDHHAIEAIFKGTARALKAAVEPLDADRPLTTKGVIDA